MKWIKSLLPGLIGEQAEDFAVNHLEQHGISVLARNYRCKAGEIDIIAQDHQGLIFVEVKYRSSAAFGLGQEMVSQQKQKKLIKAAKHYLVKHYNDWPSCRFDVIAIQQSGSKADLEWIQNAFYTE